MPISEATVEAVVGRTSERMQDPKFAQVCVGSFVEDQPELSRFLSAKAAHMGGAAVLVHLVFHAHVLRECVEAERGKPLPVVTFAQLDRASNGDFVGEFTRREPHLSSYVASNVDESALRRELCRIGLAMCLAR